MSDPLDLGDALRDALPVYTAPERIRTLVGEQARRELGTGRAKSRSLRPRLLFAASLVATFAAGWAGRWMVERQGASPDSGSLAAAVVDTHIRALASGHLTDVLSSDRHTVKPWFAGKVPLAPAVPELAANGYPLIGGRVESVSGHPSATLVYGRRRHMIDLFIWTTPAADTPPQPLSYHGFAVIRWTRDGLEYWAVSDASAADVAEFASRYLTALR